jgi:hypothetical protein
MNEVQIKYFKNLLITGVVVLMATLMITTIGVVQNSQLPKGYELWYFRPLNGLDRVDYGINGEPYNLIVVNPLH